MSRYVKPIRRRDKPPRWEKDWNDSCDGKVRYRDRQGAKHAAMLIRASGSNLRPYGCGYCRGWHLTSQPMRSGGEGGHSDGGFKDGPSMPDRQASDRVENVG